ncbi:unnamed protein product [Rhodiola kirilowii]
MDVQGFGADDDELGVCSDSSSSVGSTDDEEVESSPLDTMDALEEVLPVRRGISKFYNGKSKSFTSLADAVSSASIKELAKPETLYSKKNVNSLRSNHGGLLKNRVPSNYGNRYIVDESCSSSISPPVCLPPLHPQSKKFHNAGSSVSPPQQKCSPWRSFSVSDLSGMVHNA